MILTDIKCHLFIYMPLLFQFCRVKQLSIRHIYSLFLPFVTDLLLYEFAYMIYCITSIRSQLSEIWARLGIQHFTITMLFQKDCL